MTGHQKMFDKALSLAMVVFGGVISVPVQPVAGVVLEVVKTCHALFDHSLVLEALPVA